MTEPLPAPLMTQVVDLSGLDYMPLMIADLLRSDAWRKARRRPEVGFYQLNLWVAAFRGKPAGSLPDDDDVLADHAKCALDRWPEVKDAAMHGFVRCADGRWYHRYLCLEVIPVAIDRRLRWRERKQRQRATSRETATPQPEGPLGQQVMSGETAAPVPQDSPLRDGTRRDMEEDSTAPAARLLSVAADADGEMPSGECHEADADSIAVERARRGTRLAPDWRPSDTERAFAAGLGFDAEQVAAEFRDYWHAVPGQRGRKLDWAATFRNRCRALAGRDGRRRPPGGDGAGRAGDPAGIAGAAARVIARRGLA
ncbi:MAG TPA: DUF1376 domain-containing protein [Vineibacter sp.]|nr:DUF1376 domain-containing protein [Vineibacter sp.]